MRTTSETSPKSNGGAISDSVFVSFPRKWRGSGNQELKTMTREWKAQRDETQMEKADVAAKNEAKTAVPASVYREEPKTEKTIQKRKFRPRSGERPETEKRKVKKQKIKEDPEPKPDQEPKPDLPQEFRDKFQELGYEEEAVLVIQKKLFDSDLNKNNNRFSIPGRQIAAGLFTEEEMATLETNNTEIKVKLIDPCFRVTEQHLKKWNMTNTSQYVLTNKWHKEVVQVNNKVLKTGTKVQLWMARCGKELCFALVLLRAVNVNANADANADAHAHIDENNVNAVARTASLNAEASEARDADSNGKADMNLNGNALAGVGSIASSSRAVIQE